jgi:sugar phosphate isomerase/epimerase
MVVLALSVLPARPISGLHENNEGGIFAKTNLIAWCIVPFDVKNRGPVQRAEMLNKLGITKLAYDWREKHIPTFDQEIDAVQSHKIKLQAFWLTSSMDPANEKDVKVVFDLLKRRHVRTQIWYLLKPSPEFQALSPDGKLEAATKAARYIAEQAKLIGCEVGLYNHGDWFGEPENELAILDRLKMDNVGLVYNFNHAQNQIGAFPQFFPKILPHLIALNLAGLDKKSRRVVAIGEGDSELSMIRIVRESSYRGPVGIINENTDPDAELGLKKNMEGLKNILHSLGDQTALATY